MISGGLLTWLVFLGAILGSIYFIGYTAAGNFTKLTIIVLAIVAGISDWIYYRAFVNDDPMGFDLGFMIEVGLCLFYAFYFKYADD